MTKDSTSRACWGDCLAMASKVLTKAAMAVSGTPCRAAALRQTSERVLGGGGGGGAGVGRASGSATTIWAAGARGGSGARWVDGPLAAGRLAGAIGVDVMIEVDEIGFRVLI